MQQITTSNPLLKSFENLGALSLEYGLIDIKPFKDWKGSSWKEKIIKFRLCNTGEILDVVNYLIGYTPEGKVVKMRHEILIRSIYSVDGNSLCTPEEVSKYNEVHKTDLSVYEFLGFWIRNLEDVVVERLDGVYAGLQYKQSRKLRGIYLCEVCGKEYKSITEGFKRLKYALAEVICKGCCDQEGIDFSEYDIEELSTIPAKQDLIVLAKEQVEPSSDQSNGYKCKCGEEFEELESFMSHRETCPKAEDSV